MNSTKACSNLTGSHLTASIFRILGNRVSELEKKLRTLEVSGLWNVPGEFCACVILERPRVAFLPVWRLPEAPPSISTPGCHVSSLFEMVPPHTPKRSFSDSFWQLHPTWWESKCTTCHQHLSRPSWLTPVWFIFI